MMTSIKNEQLKYNLNSNLIILDIIAALDERAAKKTLLLQLMQEHGQYYTLTFDDKRLIEEHLLTEIRDLQSRKSVHDFYKQHADSLYLNQHRHTGFDSMRQKPFPRIKENILKALNAKFMQMSNEVLLPHSGEENETVDNQISNLKLILETKRDALLKQDKGATFFLFYSSSRTAEKIEMIDKSLEKLGTIIDFYELKMFTENLLLNNELIARRSLGITSSDTYLKLKAFYDNCFLVSENGSNSNKRQARVTYSR